MKTRMRMLSVHHRQLRELLQDTKREQACFLLCSFAQGDGETILLVNEVVPLVVADLSIHRYDQLSVSPAAMLRVSRMAQRTKRAICMGFSILVHRAAAVIHPVVHRQPVALRHRAKRHT